MKLFNFLLGLVIIGISLYVISGLVLKTKKQPQLTIGSTVINIEIADTPVHRSKGLSNRQALSYQEGMLFIFPSKERYNFWMKDMRFCLDFIWIADNKVAEINPNIKNPQTPSEPPQIIIPSNPVNQVLEVTCGFVNKYQIKVGDEIYIKK